jgi:8-amino-7-oxononanoate synthase
LRHWTDHCRQLLSQRQEQSVFRSRQVVRPIDAVHVEIDSTPYVNFSSNNYLGLTHHPRMLDAVQQALSRGAGSGAAGLITGHTDLHASAEHDVARWKGSESAVLLPSGYQANLAAVQTLHQIGRSFSGGVRFLVDKLAHASLIDAVHATQAPMRVLPHNSLGKLRKLLEESDPDQLQVVLTESIFSMDGQPCDLHGLAQLKQAHPFLLLLDEAHASGVYGHGGAGLAAEMQLQHAVDVSIITLSKAVGCVGGAVCASALFCDALVNFGRAYIYSTSVSPGTAAGVKAAIQIMADEPQRQQRVRELARRVRRQLGLEPTDRPIIPIVLGTEQAALHAVEVLKGRGILARAVRPPTVPRGTSRLRITMSCEHSDDEVDLLIRCLAALPSATPRPS